MNDLVISNNDDRDIVLATIANTVNDFCNQFGNHFVYAKGSTSVRTRLYQMGISNLLDDLNLNFYVFGVIDDIAYPFERNVNYEAFLIKKK